MKLLLAVSSLASIITFSPVVYQAGVISSAKLLATKSPLDYDSINVYTDLRLLYGDSNDDGIIDDNEYYNFDYKKLIKAADESQSIYEDFNLLTFVPVHNDIYFYFYSTLQLDKNNLQVSYSDSQILNENSSLGYVENNQVKDLIYINKYNVENGYFYKFKLENFSSNTNTESQNRIRIFEFITFVDNQRKIFDYSKVDPELWYVGEDLLENNYYYFKNNVHYYEARLGTALGVIDAEDYFPVVSAFYIRSNTATETNVKTAKEITYMFVDFTDIEISDLISVEVEYYKLSYDYIRYSPFYRYSNDGIFTSDETYEYVYGDVFAGKYESKEYGFLENGISLNGKTTSLTDYNENVLVFTAEGNSETKNLNYDELEEMSDNSGIQRGPVNELPYGVTYYNPNFNELYNGFYNAKILNNGQAIHKTISSDYDQTNYSYQQINEASSYWQHVPYKRTYNFKPIVNLSNIDEILSGDEYKLSREFFNDSLEHFKKDNFNPSYAILIDGANSDTDCDRVLKTNDDLKVNVKTGETMPASGEKRTYEYSLKYNVTACHEIYNSQLLKVTARENNGENITFNAIGNPAYVDFITFTGYKSPTLVNYILSDVNDWWSNIIDTLGNWIYLIAIILAIILIAIISPVLVPIIKFILKIIAWPFKTIYKAIKKNK